jgi:hypothetical protein
MNSRLQENHLSLRRRACDFALAKNARDSAWDVFASISIIGKPRHAESQVSSFTPNR